MCITSDQRYGEAGGAQIHIRNTKTKFVPYLGGVVEVVKETPEVEEGGIRGTVVDLRVCRF